MYYSGIDLPPDTGVTTMFTALVIAFWFTLATLAGLGYWTARH